MALGEIIPDGEILFKYVKPEAFPPGQTEVNAAIFQDGELSCDWKRYRFNPFTSKHISKGRSLVIAITVCDEIRNPRNPRNFGLLEPGWHQEIIHDPTTAENDPDFGPNEAHSLIKGKKKAAIIEAIKRNSRLISHPNPN